MSKFCPICNKLTNCTDNCNSCMKEEENKMQTLTLKAWGKSHEISFHLANYADNGNLYVGMICHDDGYPEAYGDLTVNLDIKLPSDRAYVDYNNNGREILHWLIDNELGIPAFATRVSGFCEYPEFIFNMPELMKYVTLDDREVK